MKKGVLILILLVIGGAHAKSYYYDNLKFDINLLENGDLKIIEEQTIVFSGAFTYIYKDFNSEVKDFKITGDITHYKKSGNEYTWYGQWADATKTFKLEYTFKDPFEVTRDYDKLWHTIIPYDHSVTINNVEATYHFPQSINTTEYRVSKLGVISSKNDTSITIRGNNIPANKALDFEITLPKNVIEPPMSWKNIMTLYPEIINLFVAVPIIIFIWLTIKSYQVYFKERDLKKRSAHAYKAIRVESLAPAIAGLLIDYRVNTKEVTATIIDLAIQGYIYIHKIVKPLWPDETRLVKVKDNLSRLNNYEKKIMNTIFKNKKEVSFHELQGLFCPRTKTYSSSPLYKIMELIKDEAVNLGLADKRIDKIIINKISQVIKYNAIAIGLSLIHLIVTLMIVNKLLLPVTILIIGNFAFTITSSLVLAVLSTKLVKISGKGENAKQTYKKLKEYIKTQPLTEGRLFDTYLPYAIALGVQKKWVKKAESIGYDTSRSSWHSSNINGAAIIAINTSLATSMTPSRSSSGGGGFGGGGGVGGGGMGAG